MSALNNECESEMRRNVRSRRGRWQDRSSVRVKLSQGVRGNGGLDRGKAENGRQLPRGMPQAVSAPRTPHHCHATLMTTLLLF